jgi:hypothetical protein
VDDVLGIIGTVGVVDDAGAVVGGDLILVHDPFEGAAVAEAVFVDLGESVMVVTGVRDGRGDFGDTSLGMA